MHLYLEPISALAFLLFWGYLAWSWFRWLRPREKGLRTWRSVALATGLCFATISSLLQAFLYIHAVITGGYPLFDPIDLFCLRVGALAALLGLAAALVGNGRLRVFVAVIATLNLFLWFVDAMAQ